MLQVNGKNARHLLVPREHRRRRSWKSLRWRMPSVIEFTKGLTIRKVVVVPGKLVNIVAN